MTNTTWQPIETAPRDGTRIRLGNELDASSMRLNAICPIMGEFDGREWGVSAFFVIPGGRYGSLTDQPTHWMPAPEPQP